MSYAEFTALIALYTQYEVELLRQSPIENIERTLWLAQFTSTIVMSYFSAHLDNSHPGVRYWANHMYSTNYQTAIKHLTEDKTLLN